MKPKKVSLGARLAARGVTAQGGFTLPELLVTIVISGIIVGALAAAFAAGTNTSVAAKTRLDESRDAQLVATYWASDAASSSAMSTSVMPPGGCDISDISGGSLVAGFTSTDPATGMVNSAAYVRSSSNLIRRACQRSSTVNTKQDITLANNLPTSGTPAVATCPVEGSCIAAPARVQLQVNENSGYNYTAQGALRTDPPSGSPLLGNIAIYVGGSLTTTSHSTVSLPNNGVMYVNGSTSCSNQTTIDTDYYYRSGSGDANCPASGVSTPFPDPLASIAVPTRPANASAATAPSCVPGTPTYQPGAYTSKLTISGGCLASGVYYLDAGAHFTDVQSAAGGVLIYVNGGDVDFDGKIVLSPMTGGTDPGVTLFARRDLADTTTIQTSTGSDITIDGVIYAAGGTLSLKNNNSNLTLTGAIDVNNLNMTGQGSGSEGIVVS